MRFELMTYRVWTGRSDQLSYAAIWLRGQDSNLRPSGYEPDELPSCSTPRYFGSFCRVSQNSLLIILKIKVFVNCFFTQKNKKIKKSKKIFFCQKRRIAKRRNREGDKIRRFSFFVCNFAKNYFTLQSFWDIINKQEWAFMPSARKRKRRILWKFPKTGRIIPSSLRVTDTN